ncbi:MAG: RNA 2',3'-cyclic phosphodiesterase [Parasulfuritortus sp.]|nr:RNA 2',3'-cyclic phosphodiesterase [Parasulfuritortus sp.]
MPDHEGLNPARVFLALWPDHAVQKRLAEEGGRLHSHLAGRLSRPDTLHLTLVFIGNLARARLPELREALRSLASPGFQIDFDRADCWRHNRIVYLAPGKPPDVLYMLVASLEKTLDALAIPFDRRPYCPHVTLLRKAECQKGNPAIGRVPDSPEWGDFAPIKWSARDFVLVESVSSTDGTRYQVLDRFLLS